MYWEHIVIAGLFFALFLLWGQWDVQRASAWKWRKRWIEQRFGIEVIGMHGDYFCVMESANGKKCILFSRSRNGFPAGSQVRKWNHHLRTNAFPEDDCDMPSEKELFLSSHSDS
jgi:hypothetical protein